MIHHRTRQQSRTRRPHQHGYLTPITANKDKLTTVIVGMDMDTVVTIDDEVLSAADIYPEHQSIGAKKFED